MDQAKQIWKKAKEEETRSKKEGITRWRRWAKDSFTNGGGRAHRYTKAVQCQAAWQATHITVEDNDSSAYPYQLTDKEWEVWQDI